MEGGCEVLLVLVGLKCRYRSRIEFGFFRGIESGEAGASRKFGLVCCCASIGFRSGLGCVVCFERAGGAGRFGGWIATCSSK